MTDKENARPGDSRENGRNADKQPQKYQGHASKASFPPPSLEEAREMLSFIEPRPQQTRSLVAFALYDGLGDEAAPLFYVWIRQHPENNAEKEQEAKTTWHSAKKPGKTKWATLIFLAKERGYQPTRSTAPPSPEAKAKAEQERAKRQAEAQRKAEEAATEAAHAEQRAAEEHGKAQPVPESHGYPVRKKLDVAILNACGCKIFRGNLTVAGMALDGCLMVPAMDMDGSVKSLQFIHPDTPGKNGKRNLPKASMKGHFWRLGEFSETGPIYLAENPATAASIHEASQQCALCTFSGGNMEAVALAVRERYPQAKIILCADDDPTGKVSAILAAQAVGGLIALPNLVEGTGKDFNDQHQAQGLESVRVSLATTYAPEALARLILADPATPETTRRKLSGFAIPEDASVTTDTPDQEAAPQEIAIEDDSKFITRLARLSEIEYERQRETAAEQLKIKRVSVLDDLVKRARKQIFGQDNLPGSPLTFDQPEPWSSPVDGETLLNEIVNTILLFCVLTKHQAISIALWIIFTYALDVVHIAPILYLTSPEKRCGKSTLLQLLLLLVSRPLPASNITPSSLFRTTDKSDSTLVIDEADTGLNDNEDMRCLINSGHSRPLAFVIRIEGDSREPRKFSTWGARAIAGIGKGAETIMDRSIVIELRRKLPTESIEKLRNAPEGLLNTIKRKIIRFVADQSGNIANAKPDIPTELNDRATDNWEPLLSIADIVGGTWPEKAREAALILAGSLSEPKSLRIELLEDIHAIFNRLRCNRIATEDLLKELNDDPERPWATYTRGKPLMAKSLSAFLGHFSIHSKDLRIDGYTTSKKGFEKIQFIDAFERYLPAAATAATNRTNLSGARLATDADEKAVPASSRVSGDTFPTDEDSVIF